MKRPLKTLTKDYFEQPQLEQEKLEQFEQLLDTHVEQIDQTKYAKNKRPWFALMVSGLLVVIAAGTLFSYFQRTEGMQQKIAEEVARNHIKLKPLEVSAKTIDGLRHYFGELDFVVTKSNYFSQFESTVIGGRYCSIQGVTAAQLRFSNAQGENVTLYEVGYDSDVFGSLPSIDDGETPVIYTVRGTQVKIWREKGLLMASVQDLH